jgi:hypothetical protein
LLRERFEHIDIWEHYLKHVKGCIIIGKVVKVEEQFFQADTMTDKESKIQVADKLKVYGCQVLSMSLEDRCQSFKKVLESVSFFSRGQKVLRLKFPRSFLSIESEYVRPSAAADFAC